MPLGIDVGTSQRYLNFGLARSMGYESCYVKLGGDNVGRYVAPHYTAEVDSARRAGMRVGHYWVVNGRSDVISAADFFVNNLRGWTASDFIVLDNEPLDGATMLSDSQAAAWINRVKSRLGISGSRVIQYLGLSYARSATWPASLGTGCNFVIAAYGYAPWTFALPTIPGDRVVGHQYSSSVSIGGVITDVNSWKASAFSYATTAGDGTVPLPEKEDTDTDMKIIKVAGGTIALVGEYTGVVYGSVGGGHGFSIGVNAKAYGEVTGLTGDEVTTLVNEANARRAALVADIAKAMTVQTLDAAAIATSIITALQPKLGSAVLDGVTADAVAKAVEAALADNFAAIPSAVAGEQAERLGKPLG